MNDLVAGMRRSFPNLVFPPGGPVAKLFDNNVANGTMNNKGSVKANFIEKTHTSSGLGNGPSGFAVGSRGTGATGSGSALRPRESIKPQSRITTL